MSNFHRYNPLLKRKLQEASVTDNPVSLIALLRSLSVAEFRTAGFLLSDSVLAAFESDKFWIYFLAIVPMDVKAYLGTFLKAAVQGYKEGRIKLEGNALQTFASQASLIDARKTLEAFLPVVQKMDEVQLLLSSFKQLHLDLAAPYLIKAATPVGYCLLFRLLRTAEAEPATLRHYALLLIRRGDRLSFNLASIMRQYFDLKDIPGTFALRLESYELSRLEQSPETFIQILKR